MKRKLAMKRFPSKQKALDHALWLCFKHRVIGQKFGATLSAEGDYLVVETNHPSFEWDEFETLPQNYFDISYKQIRQMRQDINQLPHWENLFGTFSIMDGELLRFILAYRVNLEKFIRYELASRGHDNNHQWCGFEKAQEIWLK